ncbi:MAG: 50S ribosomal protein L15e [Nanoarchaeota archaeon]|nr:50S ribosomal protein L15e [Nanoarchaeota archaeon]MBU1704860.1 50S ribosomal protein L15e [Nanoarchaeota archaeon]
MGVYKYIREAWKNPRENMPELMKSRLIQWRKEQSTERIERPTRLDRARSLGYKAKPGYVLVRQRVLKSARMHPKSWKKGKRPKHSSPRLDLNKSYQQIAEERASKQYINCTVLNSYSVAEDGMHKWYEVILVDRAHPQITSDPKINWICSQRGRAARGLTSAGRKSRGLRNKGKGAEKLRPSKHAYYTKQH